jgi:hypothetical protein
MCRRARGYRQARAGANVDAHHAAGLTAIAGSQGYPPNIREPNPYAVRTRGRLASDAIGNVDHGSANGVRS